MKKRILSLVLAVILFLGAIPVQAFATSPYTPPPLYRITRESLEQHLTPNEYDRIINGITWGLIDQAIESYAVNGEGSPLEQLPWTELSVEDPTIDYLERSLEQFALGNFTENVTILGTSLQIATGVMGVDLPMDIRDVTADFCQWEWSWGHVAQTTIDIIAVVPIIGGIKYFDECLLLMKGGEGLSVLAKQGDGLTNLGKNAAKWFEALFKGDVLADLNKNAAKYFDDLFKGGDDAYEIFGDFSKAGKAAKKAKKIEVIDAILDTTKHSPEFLEGMEALVKAQKSMPNTGFWTFKDLKDYLGSPGLGNAWHHIVEQSQAILRKGFGLKKVNNVNNVVAIPHGGSDAIHTIISAIYNTSFDEATNFKKLRDYLADKSWEEQMRIGLEILMMFGEVKIVDDRWIFVPFK